MPLPKRPQLPTKAKASGAEGGSKSSMCTINSPVLLQCFPVCYCWWHSGLTVIEDSRFANFQTDAKFRLPSKKHSKTKLDSRFSRLLSDPDFYNKASVDRYGRKRAKDAGRKELEKFYHVDEEEEEQEEDEEEQRPEGEASSKTDRAVRKELARVDIRGNALDPIRDGGLTSSSDDSSSDDEDEEQEDVELVEQTELAGQDDEVPMGDVTSRLAAVNMDWDNIRATDIMAVANSFVPASGRILSVIIYPSEFGRERMEREEIEGPPREIFASAAAKNKDDFTTLEGSSELEDSDDEEHTKTDLLKENNGEEFDSTALRAYQLDRLRYYYAVITCSSPNVARSLYDNMDGLEYLSSANFFDLRFVPDETTFDNDPHDECETVPDGYKPNEFKTEALSHSKVKLTWDADDNERQEVQKRAFSRKELDENELQAYIGSDSEDEEATGQLDKAATLRAALGLGSSETDLASHSSKKDRDFKKPAGEMEVTFSAALSANTSKGSVFENEPIYNETTVEKYVRKQRERKQKRKERAKAIKEGRDPDAANVEVLEDKQVEEDDPWDDPFFNAEPEEAKTSKSESKKSKKAKRREEQEQKEEVQAAERANLELLMVDDDGSKVQHFDMNEILKAEKAKKKGKKKSKGTAAAVEDEFKINTNDPRFSKLYESHEFAIDPTNPRFKSTAGMKALLEEGRKKRKRDHGDDEDPRPKKEKKDAAIRDTDDLKKLAAKVRAKSKKV